VLVFVRAPERGRVKTRLAAEVGDDAALAVYRALAERAFAAARVSGADVRVHCTPAGAAGAVERWLGPGAAYLPQGEGGLGERMRAAFDAAFAAGYRRVAVIGSDLPAMSAALLEEAFRRLEDAPAVVGPAADGGYYLLALRGPVPGVFDGIDWSTPVVLRQTLDRLAAAGIRPALLGTHRDVDAAADLTPELRALAFGDDARG
jgi:uncharacterized protein